MILNHLLYLMLFLGWPLFSRSFSFYCFFFFGLTCYFSEIVMKPQLYFHLIYFCRVNVKACLYNRYRTKSEALKWVVFSAIIRLLSKPLSKNVMSFLKSFLAKKVCTLKISKQKTQQRRNWLVSCVSFHIFSVQY